MHEGGWALDSEAQLEQGRHSGDLCIARWCWDTKAHEGDGLVAICTAK